MSYSCERCGTHLDDLATQCGCNLPPTKAEIKRARIGHAAPIMDAVIAERDRLAAENAELRKKDGAGLIAEAERLMVELSAANAMLDRLREAVPEVLPPHMSWKDALDGARAILYPKETDNGN